MASMKTTIDIADTLLREAKRLAAKEGVTLKVVVERGLRQVVARKERQLQGQRSAARRKRYIMGTRARPGL